MTEKQQENRLLRNVLFVFFISGTASQPLGSFIPFLRDTYGFSYDLSGVLLSCQSIGNLAAVLAAGFLPSYLGRRKSILITAIWMAVGYFLLASGIASPIILALAFLMTGVARGGNSNFSNTMISTLPEPRATQGYNLLHGCFAIGALLSPLLLVGITIWLPVSGWRIMAAGLCVLSVVQLIVYGKMPLPEEAPKGGLKSTDRSFLKNKSFWLGSAMLLFYISAEYAIVGWLVTYFMDIGILNPNQSQIMNSLLWLVIFAGRMVGAAITGKVSQGKLLIADGIGFFAFFLLMFLSRTPAMIVAGLIGAGFFMATIYPTAFAFGSASIKGNDLGCSTMIFTGSLGGVITPAVVGLVAEKAGIRAGMGLVVSLTAALLISILLSVFTTRKEKKHT